MRLKEEITGHPMRIAITTNWSSEISFLTITTRRNAQALLEVLFFIVLKSLPILFV